MARSQSLVRLFVFTLFMVAASVASAQNTCFTDQGAGSINWNVHSNWAQSRNASALTSELSSKLSTLFSCASLNDQQLFDTFADISVIVARYVPNAACFHGDQGAVSSDRAMHRNWAQRNGRNITLNNLRSKVSDAMGCIDRSRQAAYYSDVSVAIAGTGVANVNGLTSPGGQRFNGQDNVYSMDMPASWIRDDSITGTAADATFRAPEISGSKSRAILTVGLSTPHRSTLEDELAYGMDSSDTVDRKSYTSVDGANCLSAHTTFPSTHVLCKIRVNRADGPHDAIFFAIYTSRQADESTYLNSFWNSVNSVHFASNVGRN